MNWARLEKAREAVHPDVEEFVAELREFLDGQADAEYFTDSPTPVPNKAMRLLVEFDRLRSIGAL